MCVLDDTVSTVTCNATGIGCAGYRTCIIAVYDLFRTFIRSYSSNAACVRTRNSSCIIRIRNINISRSFITARNTACVNGRSNASGVSALGYLHRLVITILVWSCNDTCSRAVSARIRRSRCCVGAAADGATSGSATDATNPRVIGVARVGTCQFTRCYLAVCNGAFILRHKTRCNIFTADAHIGCGTTGYGSIVVNNDTCRITCGSNGRIGNAAVFHGTFVIVHDTCCISSGSNCHIGNV